MCKSATIENWLKQIYRLYLKEQNIAGIMVKGTYVLSLNAFINDNSNQRKCKKYIQYSIGSAFIRGV
jgi:hypothetical protein